MSEPINVGDWIRYQHLGRLVVGVVEYIRPRDEWDSTPTPWTVETGAVSTDSILEVRRDPLNGAGR